MEMLQRVRLPSAWGWHVSLCNATAVLASKTSSIVVALTLGGPPATGPGQPRNFGRARVTSVAVARAPSPCLHIAAVTAAAATRASGARVLRLQLALAGAGGVSTCEVELPLHSGDWQTGSFFVQTPVDPAVTPQDATTAAAT